MRQTDEAVDSGEAEIRHQIRHQMEAGNRGKPGPGRPRNAPPHCRYAGWTKKHGHRYQPCPRVDGKHVYGKYGTYEEAVSEVVEMLKRARASAGVKFVSLEQACQLVLDAVKSNEGTWRSYEENFQTLAQFFGADTPLQEITSERVEEFIVQRRAARVRGKVVTEGRIRKNLGALRRVFRLAIRRKNFAGASPLDCVEWPKSNRVQVDGLHYDVAEIAEIVKVLRARTEPTSKTAARLFLLLFFTGFRRDELCKLTVGQVDRKAGLIRNVEGKTGPRDFPISAPLALLLDEQKPDGTGHLIPAGKARGPRKEGNRLRTDLERREYYLAGIFYRFRDKLRRDLRARFHPHSLRHSFKTFVEANGVHQTVSDRVLGHGPRDASDRYRHAKPLQIRTELLRALDPLLYLVKSPRRRRKARA